MTIHKFNTMILVGDGKDARIMIFITPDDCSREFARLKRKHEGDGG
ncbi:hypothetical protein [Ochrobactrum chromiisoli]|uniref:BrnT family toxin n=1 Tax=Ochrobactrum chromiisoli TaxID=2993941 RepID=A0ABT3QMA5_9HYPH|nr:hypothetical protein [Ochrobactrum chromiisoli]MCX2696725.1 hypothetical protein [Ochrobactrum chromiisoli]